MLKIEVNHTLKQEHYLNVKKNLQKTIKRIIRDKGLKKKDSNGNMKLTYILNIFEIQFLRILRINRNIEFIINLSAEEIPIFIRWSRRKIPQIYDKTTNIYKCIYNIFVTSGYEKHSNLNKYDFVKKIGLNSCPYCNRNYIYTIARNRKIKGEIDHFYPKELYPIIALSFYNLIPSCPTCNGFGAKSNQDTLYLNAKNPYLLESNDFKFNFNINSMSILNPLSNIDENSIDIFFDKEINSHQKLFFLKDLYQEHRDVVIELYLKMTHEYVKEYIDYLKDYDGLELSEDEIYRLITCGYKDDKDLHKRPLSKLIKDISEELDLI